MSAISKVVYGNTTLVDLTEDTVESTNLWSGETAHGSDGELITGTATKVVVTPDDTTPPADTNVLWVFPDTEFEDLSEEEY